MHAILQGIAIPFVDVRDIAAHRAVIRLDRERTDRKDDVVCGLRLLDVEVKVGGAQGED